MAQADVDLALWFGRAVVESSGNVTQTMLVEDLAERVDGGEPYASALAAVTTHDPRAGDFGLEIVGSMIAVAVVEGLKAFFQSYLKELEEKAGKSLADMSVDWIKAQFQRDAAGPKGEGLRDHVASSIKDAAKTRRVTDAEVAPAVAAIAPALAAGTSTPN